jgi:hypothetical protein
MAYWRMQLHPSEPGGAVAHSVKSLEAGYIGLGFGAEVGDLTNLTAADLPANQQDYLAFAQKMKEADRVLIVSHHFPLAVCEVAGPYNYIREHVPELGIWFRHFRAVRDVRYYADFRTNAREWERLTMTDTISPLRDPESASYRLIRSWCGDA